jgi:hypothetical protein
MRKPEDTNGGNQKITMGKPEDINGETRRYQWVQPSVISKFMLLNL